MVPWNPARTKVQIRLSIQRLRTLQEKKLALAKKSRREIADLVLKGRIETARLRVEGLIQDDIYVELLEVLELYAETLQARFGLLESTGGETPEGSIADAVNAIVYSAPRTELKELHMLREMLMHKYGRQFSLDLQTSDPPPLHVPKRVTSKLAVFVPGKDLVDAYLSEIAKGYGVAWVPDLEPLSADEEIKLGEGGDEADRAEVEKGTKVEKEGDDEGSEGGDEGVEADKGKSSSDLPPAGPEKDAWASGAEVKLPSAPAPAVEKKMTPEEELAKRFERLKQLR